MKIRYNPSPPQVAFCPEKRQIEVLSTRSITAAKNHGAGVELN